MSLSPKQRELISQLEALPKLAGRYTNLKCINRSETLVIGVLSLVFKAYDSKTQSNVAIKFFDPDRFDNLYRLGSFRREPELLQQVIGQKRCLQIIEALKKFAWYIETPAGPMEFPVDYFVTEWIDDDVDSYILDQKNVEAILKIKFFKNLLLSVEAIHRKELCHRDLKRDNIRSKVDSDEDVVALIDFGTAARNDSEHLKEESSYSMPVGAKAISPPESFAGFAGDRKMGYLADHFALGTILYDLFNESEFRYAQSQDTQYKDVLDQMVLRQSTSTDRATRISSWKANFRNFKNVRTSPQINEDGNSIPLSVQALVVDIYQRLIHFDFMQRETKLALIRSRIDIAMKVLVNTEKEQVEIQKRKNYRRVKIAKAKAKEARLMTYLSSKGCRSCS